MRRVYENQHGVITLDSDMFGERKRISTGKKGKRFLSWYEKHFDEEYKKLYELKFGTVVKSGQFTFREYGEMVLEITRSNRNEFSQRDAQTVFKKLCTVFGELMLDEIRPTNIMKWQNECGLAPKTILNYRGYLNMVLKTALHDDLITKNPMEVVKAPKKKAVKKKVFYYEDDIKKLIAAADGQMKNVLQFALFSGLRGSELIALRWSNDIDFNNEVIKVDTRIREGVEDHTKSDIVRYIPMFKQAKEALLEQRRLTALRSDYVFLTQYGKPYKDHDSLTVAMKKVCKKAGVEEGGMHDLRRSFNTLLKQKGFQQDWILDVMGHMDDDVNRGHYTGSIKVDMTKLNNIAI